MVIVDDDNPKKKMLNVGKRPVSQSFVPLTFRDGQKSTQNVSAW